MNHQEAWDALIEEFGSDAEIPLAIGQWWDDEPAKPVESSTDGK